MCRVSDKSRYRCLSAVCVRFRHPLVNCRESSDCPMARRCSPISVHWFARGASHACWLHDLRIVIYRLWSQILNNSYHIVAYVDLSCIFYFLQSILCRPILYVLFTCQIHFFLIIAIVQITSVIIDVGYSYMTVGYNYFVYVGRGRDASLFWVVLKPGSHDSGHSFLISTTWKP